MSIKRISLAVATAALSAGLLTTAVVPAQAASADPGQAVSVATPKPNYKPIPADATTKKGVAKKGLDFGYLTKVTLKDGKLTVRFDRAEYYDGPAAKKLNGGVTPADDYLIKNQNKKLRTFTISRKASLIGTYELLGSKDQGHKKITRKLLVKNFNHADSRVPVWVRHTNGDSGTITALAEQFLP